MNLGMGPKPKKKQPEGCRRTPSGCQFSETFDEQETRYREERLHYWRHEFPEPLDEAECTTIVDLEQIDSISARLAVYAQAATPEKVRMLLNGLRHVERLYVDAVVEGVYAAIALWDGPWEGAQ